MSGVPGLREHRPVHFKACIAQHFGDIGERSALVRRYRWAADEALRQGERRIVPAVASRHQSRSSSLMLVFARVCASTRLTITAQESDGPGEPSGSGLPGQRTGDDDRKGRHAAAEDLAGLAVDDLRGCGDEDAHREDASPRRRSTPSTTSERAPMKQLSSMIVGLACSGSSTPPMPTPPERCTFLPICAQEPTVAQVSTIVPSST